MKPYPNYKGHKLRDINPTAIALVTEGANRQKFFLSKLNKEGVPFMKKETALALVKSGTLSEDQAKLVISEVADAERAEVQKAYDDLKKAAEGTVDMEKLATSIADKIVKAQSAQLTEIVTTLKATVASLEKLSGSKLPEQKPEDKELTQAELDALVESEMGKE